MSSAGALDATAFRLTVATPSPDPPPVGAATELCGGLLGPDEKGHLHSKYASPATAVLYKYPYACRALWPACRPPGRQAPRARLPGAPSVLVPGAPRRARAQVHRPGGVRGVLRVGGRIGVFSAKARGCACRDVYQRAYVKSSR